MDQFDLVGQHIILFDGICNLCNRSVIFVLQRDRAGVFRFASIQSRTGVKILNALGLPRSFNKSVIYLEKGKPYFNSTAALRICAGLPKPWSILGRIGLILPLFIRDPVYRFIAENRYSWFGRRDWCLAPARDLSSRFL